ncbi:3-oxoacyl-[acyl-carrier-protein] synthase, mitochondrial-like isoform X2 [Babylonia areolata]|uniref:3-oxoacyl-[acyl-carrier-protein] synthase, mitochondrial-like isoform X2 n=1 Tax=Babylonia areolata TaxID=304850 RepID=UPI003FD52E79
MTGLTVCRTRYMSTATKRRVVVTGFGLVTCLGVGVETVWNRLLQGRCGLRRVEGREYEQIPCQVVGRVPCGEAPDEFSRQRVLPSSGARGVTLATAFALAAAEEALTLARWKPQSETERERTGVCIGSGMVALEEIADAAEQLRKGRYRRLSPWFITEILLNNSAGHVSLAHGLRGPNHCVSTACTTGAHAVGDACRFIGHGDADVMVAGGAEACVTPLALAGFSRMRALSTSFNDRPEEASRPFDAQREGFVMSEGAGIVVLEELSHAQQRGATILGEVLGYGLSGDANHITAPSETGDGARRCMEAALRDGGVSVGDVGHVNAHATSTPRGDAAESQAIQKLLGPGTKVTSTKGE